MPAKSKSFQYKKLAKLKEYPTKDLHPLHEEHINELIKDAEEYLASMEEYTEAEEPDIALTIHEFAAGIIHALELFITRLKKQTKTPLTDQEKSDNTDDKMIQPGSYHFIFMITTSQGDHYSKATKEQLKEITKIMEENHWFINVKKYLLHLPRVEASEHAVDVDFSFVTDINVWRGFEFKEFKERITYAVK